MNKYKFIKKYPIFTIGLLTCLIFIAGPIIISLILAIVIVLPMYLAVQILCEND
tara:strand:- start:413 stop:574 length:162 start_codon:yes stop_codon:yes gene_type:complete